VTPEELAGHWETEAETCLATAENTRSLDLYVREHARAVQLRQCAAQLRLTTGATAALADALAKLTESRERVMYAALIDVTHGDPNDALQLLNEQLDGFDGPQWNGTETGEQWLERTREPS
jgi:hypothetical protein